MWHRRLTFFRDRPDPDKLRELTADNWRLFRVKDRDIWLLDREDAHVNTPIMGGYYDSLLSVPHMACAEFDTFLEANAGRIEAYGVHRDILNEALYLSEVFNTLVLSSYSDDEDSDFVAVAREGRLLRLRFGPVRELVRQLPEDEARAVETEIGFTDVSAKEIDPDRVDVSEYECLEVLKSEGETLRFHPYSRYVEGHIGRQGVFRTLWHTPDDTIPNLLARNAHIELKDVFGLTFPDYPEDVEDFELMDQHQIQISLTRRLTNFVLSLGGLIGLAGRALIRKHPLKLIFGLMILAVMVFGPARSTDDNSKLTPFDRACLSSGGEPMIDRALSRSSPGLGERCMVDGVRYPEHLIPSPTGETRVLAVHISQQSCESDPDKVCILLEGEAFDGVIEGFVPKPGDRGVLLLDRTTMCDPVSAGVCADGSSAFRYVLRRQLLVSSQE